MTIDWSVLIAFAVICAALTGMVAHIKGRDMVAWTVGGFIFGVFALVAVLFISSNRNQS